ncbi:hypothetical protein V1514DRAFT_319596 [Lipomyces japonicus]|uniref:uncharacterized protein n=1 Tax=Lipomyces japonicus TaxID=56871 RepID=UPI0034CEFA4F
MVVVPMEENDDVYPEETGTSNVLTSEEESAIADIEPDFGDRNMIDVAILANEDSSENQIQEMFAEELIEDDILDVVPQVDMTENRLSEQSEDDEEGVSAYAPTTTQSPTQQSRETSSVMNLVDVTNENIVHQAIRSSWSMGSNNDPDIRTTINTVINTVLNAIVDTFDEISKFISIKKKSSPTKLTSGKHV